MLLIIVIAIAAIYLMYKYMNVKKDKSITKPFKKEYSYGNFREAMPHMYYAAGPFDEYIWGYPNHGGKTIKSQTAKPYF